MTSPYAILKIEAAGKQQSLDVSFGDFDKTLDERTFRFKISVTQSLWTRGPITASTTVSET